MQKQQYTTANDRYLVKTPSGWSNFRGVTRKEESAVVAITTDSGIILKCTVDHKIKTDSGEFKEASSLKIGDVIITKQGTDSILSVGLLGDVNEYVYDLLQVDKNNEYYTNDILSHNCSFVGSTNTLISGQTLKNFSHEIPIEERDGISQYEKPSKDRSYIMTVDVSRGKGLDYSTFNIIDVTEMPYRQVCTFRDNFIGPVDYASIIFRMGKLYNECGVLIEINDIGEQVADVLAMDYGYENILYTESAGRSGKRISAGFGKKVDGGIRTTKTVKAVGCSILKMLLEQNQLLIKDYNTIQELSRFSKKGSSYEAESGSHDDLVMNLVIFAWLSDQTYFRDMTDINTLTKLREKTEQEIEDDLLPFGFIDNGGAMDENGLRPGFQPVNNSW